MNLIKVGDEWMMTNGELAPDGTLRFLDDDSAEESFVGKESPPSNVPPVPPSSPSSKS
jgi:hypothetical protein